MLAVILLVLSAVLVRVGLLQTVDGDGLRSAAAAQWTRTRPLPARRGSIFDRSGEELALSVPARTIAVNPKQVTDPVGTGSVFASVLGLDPGRRDELVAAMKAKDKGFVYVARQVDGAVADQIRALDLAGVSIYPEDRRTLPGGDTGRSVIGRTDIDGKGIAGLERQYQNVARRQAGRGDARRGAGRAHRGGHRADDHDAGGRLGHRADDRPFDPVRHRAGALEAGRRARRQGRPGDRDGPEDRRDRRDGVGAHHRPRRLRGHVGQLLGGQRLRAGLGRQGHHDVRALNEGTVTPETSFTVPWEMVLTKHGDKLHDSHVHKPEPMTVDQILTESSNIGTVMVSRTMGFQKQYEYMQAFGLGQRTALNFPDENARHPQVVAAVGGHREVHGGLRTRRRQQPDPADRGGQRDRQRRHVRGPQAGAGHDRRPRRGAHDAAVGEP